MSLKYDGYLKNHINAVNECYKMLTGRELKDEYGNITHDRSKYSKEEYEAYDEYFYPSDGSEVGTDPERKKAFNKAWLHHQNCNPHHWQYWCLIEGDTGKAKPLAMPIDAINEMVADWGAFAYLSGNPNNLLSWYGANKDKMILNDDTRNTVHSSVLVLWDKLTSHFKKVTNGIQP